MAALERTTGWDLVFVKTVIRRVSVYPGANARGGNNFVTAVPDTASYLDEEGGRRDCSGVAALFS
jgi:hypothetical protein